MNLLQTELSSLYSSNIIFNSYIGNIYIAGFIQSTHMNGISGGKIDIISNSGLIKFDDDITTGYNGIIINKNIYGIIICGIIIWYYSWYYLWYYMVLFVVLYEVFLFVQG